MSQFDSTSAPDLSHLSHQVNIVDMSVPFEPAYPEVPLAKCRRCGAIIEDAPNDRALHLFWHSQRG